jgi:hypothetical protein
MTLTNALSFREVFVGGGALSSWRERVRWREEHPRPQVAPFGSETSVFHDCRSAASEIQFIAVTVYYA